METFLGVLILLFCCVMTCFLEKIIDFVQGPKNKISPKEDAAIKNIIDEYVKSQKKPLTEKQVEQVMIAVTSWKNNTNYSSAIMQGKLLQFLKNGESLIQEDDLVLDSIIWMEWKKCYPEKHKKEQEEINKFRSENISE